MRSAVRKVGSLLLVLLALVACVAGLYVSAANRDIVVIDLLFWPALAVRSGLLVVLCFVAGALVGMVFSYLAVSGRGRVRQWQAAERQGRGGA